MAVTQNTYTGNGSTVLFSFTFPYLETTDIKVSVNGTITTAYTLANATTIQFNTAPANGAAIRIYRETDDSSLQATFYPGSAIRSSDLNDNFTQNLYVTQEANNVSSAATTTANTALTNANTAISTANTALSTANTASTNASAAVTTANTASTNASAAVSTANTASTNASAAVTTANSAAADAATALSTANTALSTANTASTNASAAVSTANTASTNATAAVSTANTASSNASSAVSTANTASSNASTALSTANTAISTANAAASAVANAILYDTVANVAAIPGSPSNNDAVEVVNSTGIQSFTPLSGLPSGFVGDSGLSVRLVYTTTGATWNWIQYFPNDPEDRYGDAITTLQGDVLGLDNNKLALAGGTMTGALVLSADPTVNLGAATKQYVDNNLPPGTTVSDTAPSSPGVGDLWYDSTGGRLYVWYNDGSSSQWVDASPSASIEQYWNRVGTTLSPATGGDVVNLSAGTAGAPGITFNGDVNTGIYSPGADQLSFSTNGTHRATVDSSGRLLVGTSTARANFFNTTTSSIFQVEGNLSSGSLGQAISHVYGENAALGGPYFIFGKHRSGSIGGTTLVASNDQLGAISFKGADGTEFVEGARIQAFVDGTPGADDMPGRLVFSTTADGASSPTERVRITQSGDVFIGTTTSGLSNSNGFGFNNASGQSYLNVGHPSGTNSGFEYIGFSYAGSQIGSIRQSGTTGVSFNTSSDYRLKENVVPLEDATLRVKQLKPSQFNFIAEPSRTVDGFIAHEVQAVVPECVTGEKDAVDENDNPVYQGIDQSKLVPLLTAALQEALAEIESLKARVTALEA